MGVLCIYLHLRAVILSTVGAQLLKAGLLLLFAHES